MATTKPDPTTATSQIHNGAPAPIPVLCIGAHRPLAESMSASLAPHYTYVAILTLETYSGPESVRLLLRTLHPVPQGVIVGGGFPDGVQGEIERVVGEFNAERKGEGQGQQGVKFVAVPQGYVEREGPKALGEWVRGELRSVFGRGW